MQEATSARVARILAEKGFDVYVMAGGLRAWRKAGLPTEQVPEKDLELLPRFD
jgi:rhodanese-related sulfurtransferase